MLNGEFPPNSTSTYQAVDFPDETYYSGLPEHVALDMEKASPDFFEAIKAVFPAIEIVLGDANVMNCMPGDAQPSAALKAFFTLARPAEAAAVTALHVDPFDALNGLSFGGSGV
jgi:hypothetical protein